MFILVPTLLVITGVALAARVVYKKIPPDVAVWNEAVVREDFGPTFYERALALASLKSRKAALNISTKLVYKMKITSLKTDNFFSRLLNDIRSHKPNITTEKITTEPPQTESNSTAIAPKQAFKTELTLVEENVWAVERPATELKISFAKQEQQLINQLAYNPKDVSAYKRLGWLYLENNKPMEARQAFKISVKLGSKDKVIIGKLLEMGGVVHKEGTETPKSKAAPRPVLVAAPTKSKSVNPTESRIKKTRIRKV